MSMSLRVVVPPHPLIAHWLTLLRDRDTPSPLFATAMAELGRWLTYEAVRDWLPQRSLQVQTPLAVTEGMVVDPSVPVLAVPVLRAGLGLWAGAQAVLPSARVAHMGLVRDEHTGEASCYLDTLPQRIGERVGVMVFDPMLATGGSLIQVLERLEARGVTGQRLRVITALAASPGLAALGRRFPDLKVYTACIDPELDEAFRIVPGLGDAGDRLNGSQSPAFPAEAQA
ncbi:uracil phosphoribosyltransferase [Synechococcus sp. BA-124 BA4]|uniref:uracil phosphoribosyltransferase n=1 Tax=unclassified Synechococcus TaxID=2626047 RepID=UPI002AD52521|nr:MULTISPECIES: uracil phosphoribosyltransferase [unclassified Synechococcus]MEA5398675.1 uracil phosphoribosyltransferase [Synechococcus sp. BA-124 BA4]